MRYRQGRWDTCARMFPAFVREWRGFLMPRGGAPMIVTTQVAADGGVTVRVESRASDDTPEPLAALSLEHLANQAGRTAFTTWLAIQSDLRGDGCDDTA